MITRKKFEDNKKNYGRYGSWAVWAEVTDKPKSNMGDLTILDPDINKTLLHELNPNIILVALNFSKIIDMKIFGNFHARGTATDFKTRFAVKDTILWGSYMTDIIKDHPEMDSSKVSVYLKKHPEVILKNIKKFKKELDSIGAKNPKIVAFGVEVHEILQKNLSDYKIVKIPHYAIHVSKENYREQVKKVIIENKLDKS